MRMVLFLFIAVMAHAASLTVTPGSGTVMLTATADGSPPFGYRWFRTTAAGTKPGAEIAGLTVASITLNLTDSGRYYCLVSNAVGATETDAVQLSTTTVLTAAQTTIITKVPPKAPTVVLPPPPPSRLP